MIPPETWSWLFQKGGCSTQLCKDHTETWKGSMSIINQPVHVMKCKGFKNCWSAFFQYIASPVQSTSLPSSSSSEPSTYHWVGCKQRQYMVRGSPCMDDLRPCRIGMQTSQDGFHLMHLNLEQQEVISIPPSWWRLRVEAISMFRERLNWCIYSVKSDKCEQQDKKTWNTSCKCRNICQTNDSMNQYDPMTNHLHVPNTASAKTLHFTGWRREDKATISRTWRTEGVKSLMRHPQPACPLTSQGRTVCRSAFRWSPSRLIMMISWSHFVRQMVKCL